MRSIIIGVLLLLAVGLYGQDAAYLQYIDGDWVTEINPNNHKDLATRTTGPFKAYNKVSGDYYVWNPIDSFWEESKKDNPIDLFGSLKAANRTPIIELKSTYGISMVRDIVREVGSGSVSNNKVEYNLSTGSTAGSSAILESAERGRYLPGAEGEVGIGIRMPDTIILDEDAKWGYFDDGNGLGFGVDSGGIYVFIRRDSIDSKVYQSNWSSDKLDGSGASGLELDLAEGNIFQINYSWYGYGAIYFKVVLADDNANQKIITVHKFSPTLQTSLQEPNLPIAAEVNNGSATTDLGLYVGGRQYSVYAPFEPSRRLNSHRVLSKGAIGTTFVPLVTFKRKSDFITVASKVSGLDLITDAPIVYQLRVNGNLTGASYGTPADTDAEETAMEADNTATAISGGVVIYEGLLGTTGTGNTSSGGENREGIGTEIPSDYPVTLCARVISGSNATVSAVLRWSEEW